MKRCVWLLMLAATPGCVMLPVKVEPTPPPAVEQFKEATPSPVTPEEVTEENAPEILQRLNEECERD